jgi:hypothetical protein
MKANDVVLAIVIMVVLALIANSNTQHSAIKELKESVEVVVNYDSIISAREKVLLDSVQVLRESLKEQKEYQRNENRKLRQKNEALEKHFRDLDLSDRPEF